MTQIIGLVRGSSRIPAIALLAFILGVTVPAQAEITRIVITRTQSPTFDGLSFGEVGQYEKLAGRAFGEVDPNDPRNALIADIQLALLDEDVSRYLAEAEASTVGK